MYSRLPAPHYGYTDVIGVLPPLKVVKCNDADDLTNITFNKISRYLDQEASADASGEELGYPSHQGLQPSRKSRLSPSPICCTKSMT